MDPAADPGAGPRRRRRTWPWGVVIAAVLFGLVAGRPFLERHFPSLSGPAPSWVPLLFLVTIVGALVAYVALQVRAARRRRRGWSTGAGGKGDDDAGCGGGGSGCSGADSGCGGGHGGCGGGCGGGGH